MDDPRWLTTVPQLVSPAPDEWLPGLLLRCDAVNGWASRTTMAHLARLGQQRLRESWHSDIPNLIVWGASAGYLQQVAQLVALSPQQVRGTTYTDELARLFHSPKLHATLLTLVFSFHLCPVCIAESRLLRRVLVLPYLDVCLEHQVALRHTCLCGTPLRIFTKRTAPFSCHQCGLDWGELPRQSITGEQLMLAEQVLGWYTFFLTVGTPVMVQRALDLIAQKPVRHPERLQEGTTLAAEVRKRPSYRRRWVPLPLGKLVAALVERELILDVPLRQHLTTGA
jgi:hypothetical protein